MNMEIVACIINIFNITLALPCIRNASAWLCWQTTDDKVGVGGGDALADERLGHSGMSCKRQMGIDMACAH